MDRKPQSGLSLPLVTEFQNILLPGELKASKLLPATAIEGLTCDSRHIARGNLFFAIRGTKQDGHHYLAEGLAQGAAGMVVEDETSYHAFPNTVLVASTRRALSTAASRWFKNPSEKFSLIGVTGTNGKTTTGYLLRQIWNHLKLRSGLVGTVEQIVGDHAEASRLTTPDSLELQSLFQKMVNAKCSVASMEVSSIALDQDRAYGTRFAAGVFTNLSLDHLDYHHNMDAYFAAKLRFFTEYQLPVAIVNADDAWGQRIIVDLKGPSLLTFGLTEKNLAFTAKNIRLESNRTLATLQTPSGEFEFTTTLMGRHNLYNCLGVFAANFALGIDLHSVAEALAFATGAPGRLERVSLADEKPKVFVDFAHSPDALENVLTVLRSLRTNPDSRVITVFGCGGDRDRAKRSRMAEVVSRLSDITVATSDNPRTEDPEMILDELEKGLHRNLTQFHRDSSRRSAIHLALSLAHPEDFILIAGKGHESYQIIGTEKLPFDDREVVREFYENQN